MTSEIRTNRLTSRAGLSTVTLSDSGPVVTGIATFGTSINIGVTTIHSNLSELHHVVSTGVITATKFVGDISDATGAAAGLGTALSSVQTSPLNKLFYTDRVLSIGSTITVDHPASATGAYTQYADIQVEDNADLIVADGDDLIPDILGLGGNGSTGAGGAGRLLVDNIVNRSATGAPTFPNGAVVTGVVTATSFSGSGANLTGISTPLSFRNLIINGAMRVAQRGTSATLGGIHSVDRFGLGGGGFDETPTQSQVDVASGTTPYTLGFRKAFRITNGNQTTTGSTDRSNIYYNVESQDIANSGWNYKSASSFITLSYWVKSSVSQNFFHRIYSYDSPSQGFCWETGTLSANTWTKITKTIPGNSNLVFDNNNEAGLYMVFSQYIGTNYANDKTLDTWAAFASDNRTPTYPTDWWTANDATFEMTGVQLEVGSVATPFEHRGFSDELRRCQRYCFRLGGTTGGAANNSSTLAIGVQSHATTCKVHVQHPVTMRDKDVTFTFSDLTLDDDVASYAAGRVNSISSVQTSATSSTVIFNTASLGHVRITRVLNDAVGGYIQGECEV